MPLCPVCGEKLECHKPHRESNSVQAGVIAGCPKKDGALWVTVKDQNGKGVKGVEVTDGQKTATTDDKGFAAFDPEPKGSYTPSVKPLKAPISDQYALPPEGEPKPYEVAPGQIQIAPFRLIKLASLKVIVKRSDKAEFLKEAKVTVEPPAGVPLEKVEYATGDDGAVTIPKLQPGAYKLTLQLSPEDEKNYSIDQSDLKTETPSTETVKEVLYTVTPKAWIEFKIVDKEGKNIAGVKLALKQDGKEALMKESLADAPVRIEQLEPIDMAVLGGGAEVLYEFIEVKPS